MRKELKRGSGPLSNKGTVYVVAGNASQPIGTGSLDHPAMFISLLEYGSVVIDVDGNRLDALELRNDAVVRDYVTIIKEVSQGHTMNIAIHQKPAHADPFQRKDAEAQRILARLRGFEPLCEQSVSAPIH